MADPSQLTQDAIPEEQEDNLEQDPDVNMVTAEEVVDSNQDAPMQSTATATQESAEMHIPGAPPSRKDATLREFLSKMDEYAPIIPDAVTAHYLTLSGLPPPPPPGMPSTPNSTPPHLARLLSLATQKFIADIAADAYQFSKIRAGNSSSTSGNPLGAMMPGGVPGAPVPGAAGGAAGGAGGGKAGGAAGREAHLGVQRPGFGGGGQGGTGQGRTVLTMEDLGMAVGEYGVNVRRSEFYR